MLPRQRGNLRKRERGDLGKPVQLLSRRQTDRREVEPLRAGVFRHHQELDILGRSLCQPLVERYRERHDAPPSTALLTRFLCGITTPALTRLKARQLPGFAALEAYPYAEVQAWLERHLPVPDNA
jgi:hypothetical protein